MSQLSYETNFDEAFEGLLGDSNLLDAVSRLVEGAGVLFGHGVVRGTNDNQVAAPAADTDEFQGIAIHQHVEAGEVTDKMALSILRKGRIWVKINQDVLTSEGVFLSTVAAPGVFRKAAIGSDTIDLSAFCKWEKDALAADGLALLNINMP